MGRYCTFMLLLICVGPLKSQCLSGDCIDGKGEYRYKSGDKYIGEFMDGERYGKGKYMWLNGKYYDGSWAWNKKDGFGILVYSDGTEKKGYWNKDVYKFKSGCGYGDCKNGYGEYFYDNGDEYHGNYKEGIKHGEGFYSWWSGASFEGKWEDGQRTGIGKSFSDDGELTFGYWKNDSFYKEIETYEILEQPDKNNLTWIKKLNKNNIQESFTLLCPLAYNGYELGSAFGLYNNVDANGQLSKSNVTLNYAKENDDNSYCLIGNVKNGRFIGEVFFGRLVDNEIRNDSLINKWKAIKYFYFDANGVPLSSDSGNIISNLISCASQRAITQIINDPVSGGIVAEIIGSQLTNRAGSIENIANTVLSNEIIDELNKNGYSGIAKSIDVFSFLNCLSK